MAALPSRRLPSQASCLRTRSITRRSPSAQRVSNKKLATICLVMPRFYAQVSKVERLAYQDHSIGRRVIVCCGAMNKIEDFLDECRADPLLRDRPQLLDRIETLLSRFYRTRDESPEWELTWDHVCKLFEQKDKPPAARCNALVPIFAYILQTERVG
jgi:hypothetical protein